jgi:hypothetical protein
MNEYALGIFDNIYNNFLNKLNRYQLSVISNCMIEINNITSSNVNNCSISIINKCIANSESTFAILNQCIAEELLLLDETTRKKIENELNISADEINNGIKKGYIADCYASAEVDANINIRELIINNCYSLNNIPVNLVFLNSGSASANCGIVKLNDALSNVKNSSENIYDEKRLKFFLNLSYKDYLYILIIFFGIFFIGFIILLFINNKIYLSFKTIKFFIN